MIYYPVVNSLLAKKKKVDNFNKKGNIDNKNSLNMHYLFNKKRPYMV